MFVEWTDKLKIGIDSIDEEHQSIFEEFEKLYSLMRVGAGHDLYPLVMEFLEDYIDAHLKNEEEYQESIGYNDIKAHKALHERFRRHVQEVKEAHLNKTITNKDLLALNMMIKDWFINHIIKEDTKIAKYMKEQVNEETK